FQFGMTTDTPDAHGSERISAMAVGRALIAVLAVAACAWFVLGYVQAHETARAQSIVVGAGRLTAAQQRSAADALSSAGRLNPDSTVDILRAELAYAEGHHPQAVRILESVVHREPDNVAAWAQLAAATARGPIFRLAI